MVVSGCPENKSANDCGMVVSTNSFRYLPFLRQPEERAHIFPCEKLSSVIMNVIKKKATVSSVHILGYL